MIWPTSPPPMPPPGWYADPDQQWTWRYWDGEVWTSHRAPMTPTGPYRGDPYSFSSWFQQSIDAVKHAFKRTAAVIAAALVAVHVVIAFVVVRLWHGRLGRQINDILELDELFREPADETRELTSDRLRRLGDLSGDLARQWLPVLTGLFVVFVLASLWAFTLAAASAWDHVEPGSSHRVITRLPAVLASNVLLGLIGVTVLAPVVPFAIAAAADADAATLALTGIFGFLAMVVLACWVGGRLSLAMVLAAHGGHGLGLRRSWMLTEGHYWGTVGRLLVAGMVASAAAFPASLISGLGPLLSFTAFVTTMIVGQALTTVVSIVVCVPATVVLADHLRAQHASTPQR